MADIGSRRRGQDDAEAVEARASSSSPSIGPTHQIRRHVAEIEKITLDMESSRPLAEMLVKLAMFVVALEALDAARQNQVDQPEGGTDTTKQAVESDLAEVRASDRTPGSKEGA